MDELPFGEAAPLVVGASGVEAGRNARGDGPSCHRAKGSGGGEEGEV